MSDRRRGSPAGRFVGPAGLQRLGGGDAMCPGCGEENDVGSAHCVACGRRVNAPEAGDQGLGDSVATAPTERDVWSMYASGAEATSTTGPSETTESDVAGPLPPPSGRRGDVLPAPRSADISSPARLHGDHPTPEPLERSNRPRSTLPLVALGAAVAVVLACVGLALAVRFGGGDDADTGSLGGDTQASTAVSSRSVTPTTVAAVDTATTAAPATSAATTVPVVATASAPPSSRGSVAAATSPASPVQSPSTVPPPPASPPRSVAVTSPNSNVGANVLDDPLPSGMRSAEFAPSLSAAQRLADTLASGDWNTARSLDPGLGTLNDEELEDGYGSLDRATLLLVDARRQGDNDELLFVLVANERAGAQTTLYCAQSTVSSTGVVQPRSATVLQRSSGTNGLADVQANPPVVDLIRDQCDWR